MWQSGRFMPYSWARTQPDAYYQGIIEHISFMNNCVKFPIFNAHSKVMNGKIDSNFNADTINMDTEMDMSTHNTEGEEKTTKDVQETQVQTNSTDTDEQQGASSSVASPTLALPLCYGS